jgi:hypothetical protein
VETGQFAGFGAGNSFPGVFSGQQEPVSGLDRPGYEGAGNSFPGVFSGRQAPDSGLNGPGSEGAVESPFSGLFSPFATGSGRGSSESVTTRDNVAVDAMESDLKANDVLFKTFDEPEKSDFGRFLDFQISGGNEREGKSKGSGFLGALFEGVILAGLLFALPFIVDKVIPFVKNDLIPFITGPFMGLIKVFAGFIGRGVTTVWPYVERAFNAVSRWLGNNSEGIWNAVGGALGAVADWLGANGGVIWG